MCRKRTLSESFYRLNERCPNLDIIIWYHISNDRIELICIHVSNWYCNWLHFRHDKSNLIFMFGTCLERINCVIYFNHFIKTENHTFAFKAMLPYPYCVFRWGELTPSHQIWWPGFGQRLRGSRVLGQSANKLGSITSRF